jgi:rhomboid-related protein 1/2/3
MTTLFIKVLSYVHLVSNLVMQLLLGVPLELVHKWWRISSIYLIGVASGAILFFFFAPSGYLAGASGGMFLKQCSGLMLHVST